MPGRRGGGGGSSGEAGDDTRVNYATRPRPGVASNLNGWSGDNSTTAQVATVPDAFGGVEKVLQLTKLAGGSSGGFYPSNSSERVACSAGDSLTLSAYVRQPTSNGVQRQARMWIQFYDGAGTKIGELYGESITYGFDVWQRISATAVAPFGAASCRPIVVPSVGMAAGEVCYVDGLLFEKDDTLGDYFDGTYDHAGWLGAAYVSASSTPGAEVIVTEKVPELEILRVFNSANDNTVPVVRCRDPRTGTTRTVIGAVQQATPTATLYGSPLSGASLYKSTDDGATWAVVGTIAGIVAIDFVKVIKATGTILAICRNGTQGNVPNDIYRSTDNGATFTAIATQPLTRTSPYTILLSPSSWLEMSTDGTLYLGEYHSGSSPLAGGCHIYKSTDDGLTWSVATTFSGAANVFTDEIRHIHALREDPFVPGRLTVTTGDSGNNGVRGHARLGFSEDGGATWHQIQGATNTGTSDGSYYRSRVVNLMFTSKAIYWLGDTPDAPAKVHRYDRRTGVVTDDTSATWNNSQQGFGHELTLADGTPIMLASMSVEPPFQIYRDDMLKIIGSADKGDTWHEVFCWRRTQIDQTSIMHTNQYTDPDADGAFWMTLQSADGGEATNKIVNLKMQPRVRTVRDRPRPFANHRDRFELAAAEEIVSFLHPDSAGAGATAALVAVPFWRAPTDIVVVAFHFVSATSHGSSASNYWSPRLQGRAAAVSTTVGQVGGVSNAVTAFVAWPQISANGLLKVKAGDFLTIDAPITGAPAALKYLCVSVRIRRVNVIV